MKKILIKIWKVFLYFLLFYFGTSILIVIAYRFINPPVTPLMMIRLFEQAYNGQTIKLKKEWISLDEMSAFLPQAVVAAEDNMFMEHSGFDFEAIQKAKEYNQKKKGKKVRGASTISQQTAKNVFLWPQRSWVRKGLRCILQCSLNLYGGKSGLWRFT